MGGGFVVEGLRRHGSHPCRNSRFGAVAQFSTWSSCKLAPKTGDEGEAGLPEPWVFRERTFRAGLTRLNTQ